MCSGVSEGAKTLRPRFGGCASVDPGTEVSVPEPTDLPEVHEERGQYLPLPPSTSLSPLRDRRVVCMLLRHHDRLECHVLCLKM